LLFPPEQEPVSRKCFIGNVDSFMYCAMGKGFYPAASSTVIEPGRGIWDYNSQ